MLVSEMGIAACGLPSDVQLRQGKRQMYRREGRVKDALCLCLLQLRALSIQVSLWLDTCFTTWFDDLVHPSCCLLTLRLAVESRLYTRDTMRRSRLQSTRGMAWRVSLLQPHLRASE